MADSNILDVTSTREHPKKRELVFKSFDDLKKGESFILRNDHDPISIYYHLIDKYGEVIDWDYEEKGPDKWDVKIIKTDEKSE